MDNVEEQFTKEQLKTLQKKNELLDLEIEMQKLEIERTKVFLKREKKG